MLTETTTKISKAQNSLEATSDTFVVSSAIAIPADPMVTGILFALTILKIMRYINVKFPFKLDYLF